MLSIAKNNPVMLRTQVNIAKRRPTFWDFCGLQITSIDTLESGLSANILGFHMISIPGSKFGLEDGSNMQLDLISI